MRLPRFDHERFFAAHEFDVRHVLGGSDIAALNLPDLLALADESTRRTFAHLPLGYVPGIGSAHLRAEIAGLYDGLDADDIVVFNGAEEAILTLMQVLVEPGLHAVAVTPAYASLLALPRALGADVTALPLRFEDDWALRTDALRAALSPRTRVLVWNFPHNPTGALPDHGTFEEGVRLADERNIRVVSDEVFRFLEFDENDRLPSAASLSPRAVSIGSMSKAFSLPGLRIGWVATRDADLRERCAIQKDWGSMCPSAPGDALATIALRTRGRVLLRSRQMLELNLDLLEDFFDGFGDTFSWVRPRGGTVAFPRLNVDVPARAFCDELIREEGVLLAPGDLFGASGNHIRFGLGAPDAEEALVRVDRFCKKWLTRF